MMGATTDAQLFLCLLLVNSVIPSTFGQCSTSNTHSPKPDCIDVFNVLQAALLNNTYNAFQLQSIFYPSSHLTPALTGVEYTLNDTAESTEQPLCNCTVSHPCTFTWTSRSLYQSFHPAVINQLQFQLPFVLMRLTAEALYDEPDLSAFLWDGSSKLPSVLLNITIDSSTLHDDLQQYLQSCDTVQNALGGVTKWLKAYAEIQPRGKNLEKALEHMDVNLKAFTLGESKVNQYSYTSANHGIGMPILKFVLTIGFVAALVLIPVFSVLLTWTFSDTLEFDLSSNRWGHSSSTIAGVMLVSTMFCVMAWIAELHQLNRLVNTNDFVDRKMGYQAALYSWSFIVALVTVCGFVWKKKTEFTSSLWWIFIYISVFMTIGFASHIILLFLPTVLLVFIYPVNTSALIILHVALIYSMIVIIGIFTDQMYCWGTSKHMQNIGYYKASILWFFFLFYGCCMLLSIPLSYITTIELYQFIIGRNLYDELAWSAFANYIPSVIIVVFTWLLNRSVWKKEEDERLIKVIVKAIKDSKAEAPA